LFKWTVAVNFAWSCAVFC